MQQFQDDIMQLRVMLAEMKKDFEEKMGQLEKRVGILEAERKINPEDSPSMGISNNSVEDLTK